MSLDSRLPIVPATVRSHLSTSTAECESDQCATADHLGRAVAWSPHRCGGHVTIRSPRPICRSSAPTLNEGSSFCAPGPGRVLGQCVDRTIGPRSCSPDHAPSEGIRRSPLSYGMRRSSSRPTRRRWDTHWQAAAMLVARRTRRHAWRSGAHPPNAACGQHRGRRATRRRRCARQAAPAWRAIDQPVCVAPHQQGRGGDALKFHKVVIGQQPREHLLPHLCRNLHQLVDQLVDEFGCQALR